ncbi:MAG: hypothetical protein NC177_16030 [Ruminococcus flavefaciens]|nr:hypothetical protein [Ruminococcus flavefaciens]
MKNKKLVCGIGVAVLIVAVIVTLVVSYYFPYAYVQGCLYSNKDDFERLPDYVKSLYSEGTTHITIKENSDCKEINAILAGLKKQYQKDSPYPVFSSVDVHYDSDGDVMFMITARKEKLPKSNGIESPDIRYYSLVYIDEDYDGSSSYIKDKKPFSDNWRTWSADRYSG